MVMVRIREVNTSGVKTDKGLTLPVADWSLLTTWVKTKLNHQYKVNGI